MNIVGSTLCMCMVVCVGGGGGGGGGGVVGVSALSNTVSGNTVSTTLNTQSSGLNHQMQTTVSTVLTAQSSSLDHQMQTTEFPQYSPLSPAAWTIKCRHSSTVQSLWTVTCTAWLSGCGCGLNLKASAICWTDKTVSHQLPSACRTHCNHPTKLPLKKKKNLLVHGTENITSCTKSTNWLAAPKVQTGQLLEEYKLVGCTKGTNWPAALRVQTGWLHQEYKLASCTEGTNWPAAPIVQTGWLHQ